MARNDIKNSSLLKTKFLIYAFNGRTQNRVSMCMRQNEFIFEKATICTCFGAICSKKECILPINGVRFGAKRSAFWC